MYTFIQKRKIYFLISGVLLTAGIAAMIFSTLQIGTPFRIGVDFRSGTRFEITFLEPASEDGIRDVFAEFGIPDPAINSFQSEGGDFSWQVRTSFIPPESAQAIEERLIVAIGDIDRERTVVQSVSPTVGDEVRRAATIAVIVAAIVVLVYIMFAFRQVPHPFRYGASAVVAMVHDILITFGFFSIAGLVMGWEVDALFLTAVLTVAGFSLQDTIVVFDRIRENLAKRPDEDYEMLVNRSILETIHRSMATQLSAMFVLTAILLFGGASIKSFIAALLVGLLSGTYSSVCTAVPLLVAWEKGEIPFLRPAAAQA